LSNLNSSSKTTLAFLRNSAESFSNNSASVAIEMTLSMLSRSGIGNLKWLMVLQFILVLFAPVSSNNIYAPDLLIFAYFGEFLAQ
jgi:hypothetical protein